ncbi:calcium/sodium antiporter [Tundrisphaera lichenicola]|uniref:calcium/sodium antiporter n=1 Tax=Tundrisphaera lichenicola TaxID=2029860 RepID=UPI003EB775CE
MLMSTGLILLGLLLLVLGGELLLRGAVGLATLAKVTPAVIGLTVVAAGTSVPELAVSVIAALRGSSDIAVGNIVGSNLFNIAFIIGLAGMIRPLAITGNTIKLEYPVVALVTLLYVVVATDGRISRLDGGLFLAIYVGFTAYLVTLVRSQMNASEVEEFQGEVKEMTTPNPTTPRAWLSIGLTAVGTLLLVLGANATVSGASDVGRALGLSERIIGLTIVAAGTGLPEVVTSLVSSYRGRDDVAIGNVLGSNLFNILGTLGINALIAPIGIPRATIASDNWWLLAVTLLLFPIIFTGRRVARGEGALLLVTYLIYLGATLARTEAAG